MGPAGQAEDVGRRLDLLPQLPARGGQPVVAHQAPGSAALDAGGPLLVGPAAGRAHELDAVRRQPAGDQRLDRVEARGHERGDVPAAAVLAEQQPGVPQLEQRVRGLLDRAPRRVDRAPRGGQPGARLARQRHRLGDVGLPQHAVQAGGHAFGPGGRPLRGRRGGPHSRDGARHQRRREHVEGGDDDRRVDRPERGGAGGEVASPGRRDVEAVVGLLHLGGEEAGDVHRLQRAPGRPGEGRCHVGHASSSLPLVGHVPDGAVLLRDLASSVTEPIVADGVPAGEAGVVTCRAARA
jgi:hypothetical protein